MKTSKLIFIFTLFVSAAISFVAYAVLLWDIKNDLICRLCTKTIRFSGAMIRIYLVQIIKDGCWLVGFWIELFECSSWKKSAV